MNDKVTIQFTKVGRDGRDVVKEKTFRTWRAYTKWFDANEGDVNVLRYEREEPSRG